MTANLSSEVQTIGTGNDPIVIRKYFHGIIGGATLDTSDYPLDIVKAGHIVIRNTEDRTFKPMPLTGDNKSYAALPAGYEYAGVVVRSKHKNDCRVGVMNNGEVNDKAMPFSIDGIKAALKTALPTLAFAHD